MSVRDDPQIFHIDADILRHLDAMMPVQSVLNDLSFLIQVVQNGIGIALLTRREHSYFVEFGQVLQTVV